MRFLTALLLAAAACFWTAPAWAQRVALVIGNGAYQHTAPLRTPSNDADDVAAALERMGFEVEVGRNLDINSFRSALRSFSRDAAGADVAVLFYAGHGVSIGGRNWLLPVSAQLEQETDVNFDAISLETAISTVQPAGRLGLVMIDAAADFPFPDMRPAAGAAYSTVGRGLEPVDPQPGTLVWFAARDGSTTVEGRGRNSPFTEALLRHIETPGMDVDGMFTALANDVSAATGRQQTPYAYGVLRGGGASLQGVRPVNTDNPREREARAAYDLARSVGSVTALQLVAERYPNTEAGRAAAADLAQLQGQATAQQTQYSSNTGGLRDGETFRDCPDCPEMIVIPAGSFQMGSPSSEPGRDPDEGPLRSVSVSRFAIGKFEVTFAEWDACVADGGCSHRPNDQGWGRGSRPVVNVSWNEAQDYVRWLSRKTGQEYRLLTEAEWEYAARAGSNAAYTSGPVISPDQANYDGNTSHNGSPYGQFRGQTTPVGSFRPNAFGVHDVEGNVREWVQDCYNTTFAGAPTDGSAWEAGDCSRVAMRSSSWTSQAKHVRIANRDKTTRDARFNWLGFRIARAVEPTNIASNTPSNTGELRDGETFRDCPNCPEMVVIAGGAFQMGSPSSEPGRDPDEGPLRSVTVPRFAIGKFEVTFSEWDACVAEGGCGHRPNDQGWGRGARPVVNVSWNDAQQYVRWLSRKTGEEYRLLSEAEWEFAARGGSSTPYTTGRIISSDQANYDGNTSHDGSPVGTYRGRTTPVGSFRSNAYGVYDVEGNVREWVQDCYNASFAGAPTDGSAWEAGDCSLATMRSSSWTSQAKHVRIANRDKTTRDARFDWLGFRLARVVPANTQASNTGGANAPATFRDCPTCPEMVAVPGGAFQMGSPSNEPGRDPDEGPLRSVTVSGFAVGKFEVTFAEWDACVAEGGCSHRPNDQGWGRGARPVVDVSWNDAQQYLRWLSRKTGHEYRLLSEAEWEYAARGGSTTPYTTGRNISSDQANYDGNTSHDGSPYGAYRAQTTPVGSFQPNAFGIYDVQGNVREWVQDCYNATFSGAPTDGSAWEAGDCSLATMRSSSWTSQAKHVRIANRDKTTRDARFDWLGFRVARAMDGRTQASNGGATTGQMQDGVPFRDCTDCPEMVVLPGGSYQMGSPSGEPGRDADEGPTRAVSISRFAVGRFEVTFAEWDACVADGGCSHRPNDQGWGRGARPVIDVSWNDAQQYVTWLSRKTGHEYRLLSEAEWEYAARGGATTPYTTGRVISSNQANYDGNTSHDGSPFGTFRGQTIGVGSFEANGFGLHDVQGNVREWVQDCYNTSFFGAPTDGSAWMAGDCSLATMRSSSWTSQAKHVRIANRDKTTKDARFDWLGFRVARTVR